MLFLHPNSAARERIQTSENWIYWSGLVPLWLRKHGFIFADLNTDGFVIASRGVTPRGAMPAGFYEGPFGQRFLTSLGIRARMIRTMTVLLEVDEKWTDGDDCVHSFCYARDILRRIPKQRGEQSEPYVSMPNDSMLDVRPVPVQVLEPPAGWRVIARARMERQSGDLPVIITNGQLTLAGLPVFDIVCRKHWMPPITDGYYTIESEPISAASERWLVRLIINTAVAAGHTLLMLDHWPNGKRAALTLRLDHDRAITQESLSDLLEFVDIKGVRASWGFLARLAPPEVIAAVHQCGHEIVLHTEAPDAEGLKREVKQFRAQGIQVRGVTAHGGTGSAGHRGQNYFEWARAAGLDHAELLSRDTLFPHPAVALHDQQLSSEDFYNINAHQSLDLGTAADAHQLDHLKSEVPKLLAAGEHLTIMNHPDIHRQELKALLGSLVDRDLWCATHREVVDWSRSIKYGWTLASGHEGLIVHFPLAPAQPFQLRVIAPEQQLVVACSKGTSAVFFPDTLLDGHKRSVIMATTAAVPKRRSTASLTGVFTASRDRLDADLEAAGPLGTRLAQREIRCLAQANGKFWFPRSREETGCVYVPLVSGTFDTVFLGRSLRLFRNAWGMAFITHAARALAPGGQLIISYSTGAIDQGFWRLSDLVTFFGADPIEIVEKHAVFWINKLPTGPRSILDWFYEGFADLMMDEMQDRITDRRDYGLLNDPLLSGFIANAGRENWAPGDYGNRARAIGEERARRGASRGFEEELQDAIAGHSYLMGGISYKSALLAEIIRNHCARSSGLRYCDLGGGYGLLAAEMLIAESNLVERAVNVDHEDLLLGAKMYLGNASLLRDRMQFWLGCIEDYEFDGTFDVVSLIGSLLYVRKEACKLVLDRAWNALAPGGVLVVHENIAASSYGQDFNKMFTVEEIDELLGAYGLIERYLSTATTHVNRETAAARSVFRVVTKRE